MRQLRYIASLAIRLLAALPMQAQTENQAFYIYQNDGHFDGFFYDEIEKMSFSFLDTLGVEHDEIVSQEIVTADSTYRIMLSAIDSIGFVQPEIKYNPQVHIAGQSFFYGAFQDLSYNEYASEGEVITFSKEIVERTKDYYYDEATDKMVHWPLPQVGDVFVDFDKENGGLNGWCAKIDRLYYDEDGYLIGVCKPIDDITDILQQFVAVEEYGYADDGTMVRRRVAGCPELTIGNWNLPKKSTNRAGGQWEGDLFNFSINTHIPLYISDDLNITVDPSIEGKLHLKTTWNLSLFGNKHIGIYSKLNFGVGVDFTVDGKISDFFPGGIGGLLGGVPIPATCPLILLDIAPDAFLRGEAHVNFKLTSPKLNGAMWSKLEINNWVPSIDIGFGNSDDNSEFESVDNSAAGVTMSLNGFIQTGMLFPMTFKSLPVLKNLFDSEIGGQWFVGPKLGADFKLDLTTLPSEDIATYNQLKNITFQLHMLDADYEVKGTVKTLFNSKKKEVTLADGSFSLFPPFDAKLVPEFNNAIEYTEKKFVSDDEGNSQVYNCRVIGFEPKGYVVKPVNVYAGLCSRIRDDGTESTNVGGEFLGASPWAMYYHLAQLMGQELSKDHWARYYIPPYREGRNMSRMNGRFKVRPMVDYWGDYGCIADPVYVFEHGAIMHVKGNTHYDGIDDLGLDVYTDKLLLTSDGQLSGQPLEITGNCDSLAIYDYTNDAKGFSPNAEVKVVMKGGGFTFEKNPDDFINSYNPCDTIQALYTPYGGVKTIEGEIFETWFTEKRFLYVYKLPNQKDPQTCNIMFDESHFRALFSDVTMTTTKRDDGRGWHFIVGSRHEDKSFSAEFDIWYNEENGKPEVIGQYFSRPGIHFTKLGLTRKVSDNRTVTYKLAAPTDYLIYEVKEGLSSEAPDGSRSKHIPVDVSEEEILSDGTTRTTESTTNIYMDFKILF